MIRLENDGNSLSGGNVTGQGNPRSSVSLLDNKTSSISWTNDVRVRAVSSVLEEIFTWSTISQWFYFLLFEPNLKLAAPPNLIKIQPRVKNSSSFQRHVSRATKLSLSLSLSNIIQRGIYVELNTGSTWTAQFCAHSHVFTIVSRARMADARVDECACASHCDSLNVWIGVCPRRMRARGPPVEVMTGASCCSQTAQGKGDGPPSRISDI